MPQLAFVTIPDKLVGIAQRAVKAFRQAGFRVTIEKRELGLPAAATICATRSTAKHYVLIRSRIDLKEIQTWARYCQSHTADTRFALCLPDSESFSARDLSNLRELGVGLYTDDGEFTTNVIPERDLAFKAYLPLRESMKPSVRKALGPALDEFESGDWRYGFEQAFSILEERCRQYLERSVGMGRAAYKAGAKTKSPTKREVARMTMGQLKTVFCGLVRQNQIEANVCAALTQLNPIRVKRVHNRSKKSTENKLRENAGKDMWVIINTLTDML